MKRLLELGLLGLSMLASIAPVLADGALEVIRLKHKTADQVLPTLMPLLEPNGALSGMGGSLFLRASATNRAEIKQALVVLDRPARRLMITVRQDNDVANTASGAELSGSIGSEKLRIEQQASQDARGVNVELRSSANVVRGRVYSSRGQADDRITQQVQTVEGGRALIQVGYALPIPLHSVVIGPNGAVFSENVVYRDLATGFYAQPVVVGNSVTIEISPQQESLSATTAGAVRSARLATTVSGRLGEWLALGGTNQDASHDRSGSIAYSSRGNLEQRRVLLKVEELP